MPISPEAVFDNCHEVYQGIRADLDGIAIIDPTKVPGDTLWRPNRGPRAEEYVADFALACVYGLREVRDGRRLLLLCRLYYIGLTPYQEARKTLGIREDVWSDWTEQIRCEVGKELLRRGLFPVKSYFGERSRQRAKAKLPVKPLSKFEQKYGPARHAQHKTLQ